jgi:hypothetical protein
MIVGMLALVVISPVLSFCGVVVVIINGDLWRLTKELKD